MGKSHISHQVHQMLNMSDVRDMEEELKSDGEDHDHKGALDRSGAVDLLLQTQRRLIRRRKAELHATCGY